MIFGWDKLTRTIMQLSELRYRIFGEKIELQSERSNHIPKCNVEMFSAIIDEAFLVNS